MPFDVSALGAVLQVLVAFFGAYFLAMWISLIVWTYRDIRARSRDLFLQLLSVMMVVVFNIPGLLLYFLLRPRDTLPEPFERELAEESLLQDIEEKQVCPVCHQKTQPDFLLCPNCHTKLKRQCENCRRILNLRWNVCQFCATTGCGSGTMATAPPMMVEESVER